MTPDEALAREIVDCEHRERWYACRDCIADALTRVRGERDAAMEYRDRLIVFLSQQVESQRAALMNALPQPPCWACAGSGTIWADGAAINCPHCNPAPPATQERDGALREAATDVVAAWDGYSTSPVWAQINRLRQRLLSAPPATRREEG
jgi:hypothetical protein